MNLDRLTVVLDSLSLVFPPDWVRAALVLALLGTLVVIGLFNYLNHYTRKEYFRLWTMAWVYYAMFLLASIGLDRAPEDAFLTMVRRSCIGITALYMFFGSLEFAGVGRRKRELQLGVLMILMWSAVAAYQVQDHLWVTVPVFALLAIACFYTASLYGRFCPKYRGSVVLTTGFALWGLHLAVFPFTPLTPATMSAGYVTTALIALFIAMGMMVQVLEEAHQRNATLTVQVQETTEQSKHLQAEVGVREQRYRALFDTASDATFIVDMETVQIVEANQAANHLVGVQTDSLVGRSFSDLCPSVRVQTRNLVSAKKIFETLFSTATKMPVHRTDGTIIHCLGQGRVVQCDQRAAMQISFREVTDRSQLEQQLREAEKLSALGQLIASVAHELNNPLAVIAGYCQLLSKRPGLDERTRQDFTKVVQESERASKIVRNLLTFARPRDPEKVTVDFNQLISEVLAERAPEFQTNNIRVEKRFASQLPKTKADPAQMEQVINNLISNAIQAQPPTADHVGRIEVSTYEYGAYIRITVADAGPGIEPNVLCKIFEPFFSTRPPGQGTGLGLTICHAILEEHHGKVWVQSEVGKGSKFFAEVPIIPCSDDEDVETTPAPAADSAADPAASQYRLLIVDDEPGIAAVLRESLTSRGYLVDTAGSGTDALRFMATSRYDLIITDLRMPDMDGEKLYHAIKEQNAELANRIIFLTGDTISNAARSFLDWTGNRWFSKPFQVADLEKVVQNFLRQRAQLVSTVVR